MKKYFTNDPKIEKIIEDAKGNIKTYNFLNITGRKGSGKKSIAEYIASQVSADGFIQVDCKDANAFEKSISQPSQKSVILLNIEHLTGTQIEKLCNEIEKRQRCFLIVSYYDTVFKNNQLYELFNKCKLTMPDIKDRTDIYEMFNYFIHYFCTNLSIENISIDPSVQTLLEKEFQWDKNELSVSTLEDIAAYISTQCITEKNKNYIKARDIPRPDEYKYLIQILKRYGKTWRECVVEKTREPSIYEALVNGGFL
jgi:DNA-binding NtrC family response regulator